MPMSVHRKRRTCRSGATQEPHRQNNAGFIQASAFPDQRDPARERADIPPGGARSRTSRKGRGRRIEQWQQLDPPFSVSGTVNTGGQGTGQRTWILSAVSQANTPRRWTARVACRSPPISVVCLKQGDPDWTDGLNPRLLVLYGDHLKDSLHVYTVSEFAKIEAGIHGAAARVREPHASLSRLILGQSLIDSRLTRTAASSCRSASATRSALTEGEVYFSGAGDHFEIWKRRDLLPRPKASPSPTGWPSKATTSTRSSCSTRIPGIVMTTAAATPPDLPHIPVLLGPLIAGGLAGVRGLAGRHLWRGRLYPGLAGGRRRPGDRAWTAIRWL